MSRLLTVVNERKQLRNSYRKSLEDKYIRIKKHEERNELESERAKLKKAGVKVPPTEAEVKKAWKAKRDKKQEEYNKILEGLKQKAAAEDKSVAPLIQESDLQIVA
jgi:hypothetical protein